MYSLLLLLCISLETIHFTRGQATNLRGRFSKGNVYFEWDLDFRYGYITGETVYFRLDDKTKNADVTSLGYYYLKVDILKYKNISIKVQSIIEYDMVVTSEKYNGFKIPKVIKAESGKSKEIKLPLDTILLTDGYVIKNDDTNIVLFEVFDRLSIISKDTSKYIYVRKRNINLITIKIKNATTEDAGYIFIGKYENRNGPGVVLVVTGSPTKPTIAGNVNATVGENVTLTCGSKSTSAPRYYTMLPPLKYIWFINDFAISSWSTSSEQTFRVEKRYKYDTITCMSREEMNSERSEPFRLNPQYLSEPVLYTKNNKMTSASTTFEEKQRISLSCRVDGFPLPQVSIQRDGKSLSTGRHWSNYTFSEGLQCTDTGYYNCTAKNNKVNPKQKLFHINVRCSTRLDVASDLKVFYGSQIGQTINLSVPVISNPQPNNPTWKNPANKVIQAIQQIIQGTAVYRYVIESKIHITDQSDFGNYTLFVGGIQLLVITIDAEGPPLQPSNFSGISEVHGQIHLTWISTFNGGSDQFFLLKQKNNSQWLQIENISDIGQGIQMSFVVEKTVEAGGTYEFMLQSCNRISCSDVVRSDPIKIQENQASIGDTGSSPFTVLVASAVAMFVVFAAVFAIVFFKFKRKSRTNSRIPKSPAQVAFAKEDNGDVNNATIDEGIPINIKEINDTGENKNTHSNTDEAMPIMEQATREIPANPPKTKTKFD